MDTIAQIASDRTAAAEAYERRICRPLNAVERAAVEETERSIERKETLHALWLAGLTARERRRMGIV